MRRRCELADYDRGILKKVLAAELLSLRRVAIGVEREIVLVFVRFIVAAEFFMHRGTECDIIAQLLAVKKRCDALLLVYIGIARRSHGRWS